MGLSVYWCVPLQRVLWSSQGHHYAASKEKKQTWQLGSWNVRSLLDAEGPVQVYSKTGQKG